MMIWLKGIAPAVVAVLIGGALALLFDDQVAAWWLGAFVMARAVLNTAYLSNLHYWAALPRKRDMPFGTGAWGMVLDRLGRYIKHEQEANLELVQELERIHAAVDELPDGLVVLDRFDHVEWSNNAAEDLHGIFGRRRPIHHFIRQPEFIAMLEQADYNQPVTLQLPTRPGRIHELRIYPAGDDQKLLISRDVTDQAKLDAMRRDFVANVSHEIRTPVTVIGGFAETLLTLDLDEATRKDYLTTILKQSQTMQRLVEDLLMLSSLENSSAPPPEETIDMGAMIKAIATEAQALSNGRHKIETLDESPLRVRAAPLELESAIRNLMTNAVRYTPEGGKLQIRWSIRGDEGWLAVRDTGIGIAAEHLPRLTERFYRVERGRSRESGGTGLGLAIVKHILQRHQGRLVVESEPGKGSVFALVFPRERLVAATAPTAVDGSSVALS